MDAQKALEALSPEQREKARACATPEDVLAFAKEQGYTLSDDELEAISGGGFWDPEPVHS